MASIILFCRDETTPFRSSTTKMVQFGRFLSPFPVSAVRGIYFILESVSSWGHNGERDDDPDPRGGLRKGKSKYAENGRQQRPRPRIRVVKMVKKDRFEVVVAKGMRGEDIRTHFSDKVARFLLDGHAVLSRVSI